MHSIDTALLALYANTHTDLAALIDAMDNAVMADAAALFTADVAQARTRASAWLAAAQRIGTIDDVSDMLAAFICDGVLIAAQVAAASYQISKTTRNT